MNRHVRATFTASFFRFAFFGLILTSFAMAQTEAETPDLPAAPAESSSPAGEEVNATPAPPQQPVQLPQTILPARVRLQMLEEVPIFSNGHVGSFLIFCNERLTAIAGTSTYSGSIYGELPALTVIVSLWLNPESWEDQPLILLKDPDLRDALVLPGGGTRASWSKLTGPNRLPELIADARSTLQNGGAKALTPLQVKIVALADRMAAFEGIRSEADLLFVPPVDGGSWMSIDQAVTAYPGPLGQSLPETVTRMKKAFQEADPYHFESALHAFIETITKINPRTYPEPGAYAFEVWITKADLGKWSGVILAIASLVMMMTFQRRRGTGYVVAFGLCIVGCALLLAEMIGEAGIQHVGFFSSYLRSPYLPPLLVATIGLVLELCWRKRYVLLGATVLASVLLFLPPFSRG